MNVRKTHLPKPWVLATENEKQRQRIERLEHQVAKLRGIALVYLQWLENEDPMQTLQNDLSDPEMEEEAQIARAQLGDA